MDSLPDSFSSPSSCLPSDSASLWKFESLPSLAAPPLLSSSSRHYQGNGLVELTEFVKAHGLRPPQLRWHRVVGQDKSLSFVVTMAAQIENEVLSTTASSSSKNRALGTAALALKHEIDRRMNVMQSSFLHQQRTLGENDEEGVSRASSHSNSSSLSSDPMMKWANAAVHRSPTKSCQRPLIHHLLLPSSNSNNNTNKATHPLHCCRSVQTTTPASASSSTAAFDQSREVCDGTQGYGIIRWNERRCAFPIFFCHYREPTSCFPVHCNCGSFRASRHRVQCLCRFSFLRNDP